MSWNSITVVGKQYHEAVYPHDYISDKNVEEDIEVDVKVKEWREDYSNFDKI